ncbi:MAG: hypothetical protein KGJ06_02455 [Pseudomonadota bacterium]|nr:hypothetical protein [Pseudomonadota bacterium]
MRQALFSACMCLWAGATLADPATPASLPPAAAEAAPAHFFPLNARQRFLLHNAPNHAPAAAIPTSRASAPAASPLTAEQAQQLISLFDGKE